MRFWERDRLLAVILVAVCCARSGLPIASAHPGQHLELRISISDEEVVYTVLISADLSRSLIPGQNYELLYSREDGEFHFLDAEQQRRARQLYEDFFQNAAPLTVEGVNIKPILRALSLVPSAQAMDNPAEAPPDVRLVMAYPLKGRPKQVSMVWKTYPQAPGGTLANGKSVGELVAELDAYDENKLIMFTELEPEVVWHAPDAPVRQRVTPVAVSDRASRRTIPLVSVSILFAWGVGLLLLRFSRSWRTVRRKALAFAGIGLAAAALCRNVGVIDVKRLWASAARMPDAKEAATIFASLHRNIYRAFDYKSEDDIYDVLVQSVDGKLLDQVYNEVYQSLILRDQGGAVARVQSVDILDSEIVAPSALSNAGDAVFGVRSRWRVRGAVYHWGHVHSRTNEYQALYAVAQRGKAWKITGVEVLEQQRIVMKGDDPVVVPLTAPKEAEP